MPTLIVPDRASNADIKALRNALPQGWRFAPMRYQLPEHWRPDEPVLYGDPLFCDIVAAQLGVRLVEPTDDFLLKLDAHWRQREVELLSLEAARTVFSEPRFVKPACDKSFPARVYTRSSELPDEAQVPGSTLVLLSEIVVWEREWRLFVVGGEVVASSPYFRHGVLDFHTTRDETAHALGYTRELLTAIRPLLPPVVVVDIGLLSSGAWAVVEANPAWASGLYRCHPSAVLEALRQGTVMGNETQPWLRPTITLE